MRKYGEEKIVDIQKSVGSVAADPDNLENSKEAGRTAQGTRGLRTGQVERVHTLCRV